MNRSRVGCRLIYGNDGWDVVNDYTHELESRCWPAPQPKLIASEAEARLNVRATCEQFTSNLLTHRGPPAGAMEQSKMAHPTTTTLPFTETRTFTMQQIEEASGMQAGFCLACGATRECCEPDARKYPLRQLREIRGLRRRRNSC